MKTIKELPKELQEKLISSWKPNLHEVPNDGGKKKESIYRSNYDYYNLSCGCHAEPGVFSRYENCNLDHNSLQL